MYTSVHIYHNISLYVLFMIHCWIFESIFTRSCNAMSQVWSSLPLGREASYEWVHISLHYAAHMAVQSPSTGKRTDIFWICFDIFSNSGLNHLMFINLVSFFVDMCFDLIFKHVFHFCTVVCLHLSTMFSRIQLWEHPTPREQLHEAKVIPCWTLFWAPRCQTTKTLGAAADFVGWHGPLLLA